MLLAKIWGPQDEELLVDMHVQRPEVPPEPRDYFVAWMNEKVRWARPFLVVAGIITAISIISMVIKHL